MHIISTTASVDWTGPNTQLPLNARRNECRRTCNACANRSLVHLIQLLETGNVIRLASFRARLADRHSVTGNGSGTPCAWTFGCLARACKELQCACLWSKHALRCPKLGLSHDRRGSKDGLLPTDRKVEDIVKLIKATSLQKWNSALSKIEEEAGNLISRKEGRRLTSYSHRRFFIQGVIQAFTNPSDNGGLGEGVNTRFTRTHQSPRIPTTMSSCVPGARRRRL